MCLKAHLFDADPITSVRVNTSGWSGGDRYRRGGEKGSTGARGERFGRQGLLQNTPPSRTSFHLNDGQMCSPGYPDRALVVLCSISSVCYYDWMPAGGMTNPGPRVVAGAPHVTKDNVFTTQPSAKCINLCVFTKIHNFHIHEFKI